MYRVVKIKDGVKTVVSVSESEEKILDKLCEAVLEHVSNGDEYTTCDLEKIREVKSESIGLWLYEVDEVLKLTDKEIVAAGGGVCAHCHSDETSEGSLSMQCGYVERIIDCDICGEETVEQYTLSGIE